MLDPPKLIPAPIAVDVAWRQELSQVRHEVADATRRLEEELPLQINTVVPSGFAVERGGEGELQVLLETLAVPHAERDRRRHRARSQLHVRNQAQPLHLHI